MADEVEIKFRIEELRGLARRLRGAGFGVVTPRTHEDNLLLDTRPARLRRRGELLRVRLYGTRWTVTHKAKSRDGRHKRRVETETPVADGRELLQIFKQLGYVPRFRYEKFRTEWSDGKGQVVVDETPIGNFAEVEGSGRWIDATAKRLGVKPGDYITDNYVNLFFAWKKQTGSRAREMTFREVKK